ncbi:hypothetical protein J1605_014372 [Eschrichtius robustus]|uniref:SUZ-C domain-containing protein n=1 Tax=Eschrichtius robustus TaxID=9764 RepID=A0AB34GDD7_ESCRO|nr:hypothetical protein J1605_014372 [Eschrichtius robustus]
MEDEEVAERWEEAADSGEIDRRAAGGRVRGGPKADPGRRQPGGGARAAHPRQANQDLPTRRQQAANSVTRQPLGPDGPQGFTQRR